MVELLRRDRALNSPANVQSTVQAKKETTAQNLKSLTSMIKPNQRKEILKKIFKNNIQDFEQLIQKLDSITNWPDTLLIVEAEFQKRGIYLHESNAVLFTNILYHRFFPDDDQIHT